MAQLSGRVISDCGPDGGCEECDVCRYLNFIEWAQAVAPPGSTIERDVEMEAYVQRFYPFAPDPSHGQ
jgi:hypothetical protein